MESKNEQNERTNQIIQQIVDEDSAMENQLIEEVFNNKINENGNEKFSESK